MRPMRNFLSQEQRALPPETGHVSEVTPNVQDAVQQWLDTFSGASESAETLDLLVSIPHAAIFAAIPEMADPDIRRSLEASTRAHWKNFLASVNHDEAEVHPGPQVLDFARTLARRGIDLPTMLSMYRIGQRAMWDYTAEFLQTDVEDPELRWAVLLHYWTLSTHWMDGTIEKLVPVFLDEHTRWQQGEDARRADVVNALIAGKVVDLDSAAATVQYPLDHHHTAFMLQVAGNTPGYEAPRLLAAAVETICKWIGGGSPLDISSGAHSAWLWVAQLSPPPAGGPPLELPPGVRAAVGISHSGPSGFRLSHLQARAALAVADRSAEPVLHYADVELACLANGVVAEDVRAEFIRRELGGLNSSDDAAKRIRETLRVYLQQGCDATTTGERLHLHPNGVRYRVKQAEEKLGHGVNHRRAHLELALEMSRVLG
jgi:hypothetical protein